MFLEHSYHLLWSIPIISSICSNIKKEWITNWIPGTWNPVISLKFHGKNDIFPNYARMCSHSYVFNEKEESAKWYPEGKKKLFLSCPVPFLWTDKTPLRFKWLEHFCWLGILTPSPFVFTAMKKPQATFLLKWGKFYRTQSLYSLNGSPLNLFQVQVIKQKFIFTFKDQTWKKNATSQNVIPPKELLKNINCWDTATWGKHSQGMFDVWSYKGLDRSIF